MHVPMKRIHSGFTNTACALFSKPSPIAEVTLERRQRNTQHENVCVDVTQVPANDPGDLEFSQDGNEKQQRRERK